MIDREGNIRPGKPRRGHEVVEYQRVKADVVEMMDAEMSDKEIATRLGISRKGFYNLKKRILREVLSIDIGQVVAAREFMRIELVERRVLVELNTLNAAGLGVDKDLIDSFIKLSKRKSDLMGANAPTQVTVENVDAERSVEIQQGQVRMAQQLQRFYQLADQFGAGNGSGLTAPDRDREIAAIEAATEGLDISDAEVIEDDSDAIEMGDWDCDDEIMEIPGDEIVEGDLVDIATITQREQRALIREIARDGGDVETPGRWVNGRFVSWWVEAIQNPDDDDDAVSPDDVGDVDGSQ